MEHIAYFLGSFLVRLLCTDSYDLMSWGLDLPGDIHSEFMLDRVLSIAHTFPSFIIPANLEINSSFSVLECVLDQFVCQNPWEVRFLKIWREVGRDKGFFDIAP